VAKALRELGRGEARDDVTDNKHVLIKISCCHHQIFTFFIQHYTNSNNPNTTTISNNGFQ